MKDFKHKTIFSSRIKPLVSEEKDAYLALASLSKIGDLIPDIDIDKNIDCISVGEDINKNEIEKIQKTKIIQGNLSPKILYNGGKRLDKEIEKTLRRFSNKPFIFNLSHGIMPGTPIKNVKRLVTMIRKYKYEI